MKTYKRISTALGTTVLRKLGHLPVSKKVKGKADLI